MKKCIALLSAIALVFVLCSCSSGNNKDSENQNAGKIENSVAVESIGE